MEEEKLLDAPLQGIEKNKPSTSKWLNRADVVINCLLLGLTLLAGMFTLLEGSSALLLVLAAMFPLGSYQVLSALVGTVRGNTVKGIYLFVALLYIGVLFSMLQVIDDLLSPAKGPAFMIGLCMVIFLPLIGAIYYTYLCYQSLLSHD